MLFKVRRHMVATAILLSGCMPRAIPRLSDPSGSSLTPHFYAPEQLVLADSIELRRWVGHPKQPEYPSQMQENGVEAQALVAYVIDTAGVIEQASVSFLVNPDPPFILAICRALTQTRYYPVERDGQKRRALMLHSFMFGLEGGRLYASRPPDPAAASRAIQQEGLLASVVELEHKPHCQQ
jgi:hypothetical protein